MRALRLAALLAPLCAPGFAADITLRPEPVADMKAVYGQVLSRDVAPARARISGEVVALEIEEGDRVEAGQRVAMVVDEKLALRIEAIEAQLAALQAELDNALDELSRGEALLERGVTTRQRVDALRTRVDVVRGRISAAEAERAVIRQQGAEGEILAPAAGRVIDAPVTQGSVVMAGEAVARIASGGFFLRLALPERHAALVREGMEVAIEGRPSAPDGGRESVGTIAKIYPQLESGHVVIDVEASGLDEYLVGERTLVRLPVASRMALRVPEDAVSTRSGVDFVTLRAEDGPRDVAVLVGPRTDGMVEILSGLRAGDVVAAP